METSRIPSPSPRIFEVVRNPEDCSDEEIRTAALDASAGIGEPFQYAEQHTGETFDVLQPQSDGAHGMGVQTGNAHERIGFHTDDPIFDWDVRARSIMIVGLRNPEGVPTFIASIGEATRALPRSLCERLQEPIYYFRLGFSFRGLEEEAQLRFGPFPMLELEPSRGIFRGRFPTTNPCVRTPAQRAGATEALSALYAAFDGVKVDVTLDRGRAVVFDNHFCVHGRQWIRSERRVGRVLIRDLPAARDAGPHQTRVISVRGLLQSVTSRPLTELLEVPRATYDIAKVHHGGPQ
jgi:hypothetical protein